MSWIRKIFETADKPRSMPFKEIFTFTPGQLLKSEYEKFMDILSIELDWNKSIGIIMHPFDDFDPALIEAAHPMGAERTIHGEGALAFPDGATLKQNAWNLFNMADPMFLFNFTGDFQTFMEDLNSVYPNPKGDSRKFAESIFLKRFAPIVDLLPNPIRLYPSGTGTIHA
jgi:hypothetical protein